MQRAKAFFYVCAGLFLLALSYHLGATNAGAQVGSQIEGATIHDRGSGNFIASGVIGRVFCFMTCGPVCFVGRVGSPIPGTLHVVATDPEGTRVMLENGEVLEEQGTTWVSMASLGSIATPTDRHTLGELKQRFRDPAPTRR